MTAGPAVTSFIGLGANLGEPRVTLEAALTQLVRLGALQVSSYYGSAPVDAGGPDFVNAVARLDTALTPKQLLAALQRIEASLGRQRPYHHAPRTLDLDLLLHGQVELATPTLTLPHPRLHLRAFVLRPLLELAPEIAVPGLGLLADYLPRVADQSVWKLSQ
jgi:2-amino-4-hydroxy-6-hydroxymethyldihydropteridine diphosphokinase